MQISELIPFIVILPLLSSPICAIINSGKVSWSISLLAVFVTFILSILFILHISGVEAISYPIGGWKPPIGIEYRLDQLNGFFLFIISFLTLISIIYAKTLTNAEIEGEKHGMFYSVFLLCFAGFLGITITNDLFNIYVFTEISSLAAYTLISHGTSKRSLISSFEYLILGTIGATFILIGIGFLYLSTGSLNISDIAERIKSIENAITIKTSLAFITLGLILKIGVFPVYAWVIRAYTYAPSFITAFLSSVGGSIWVYLFIKLTFIMYGWSYVFDVLPLKIVLEILGVGGIIVGSFGVLYQQNMKSLFAYSGLLNISYIIIAIAIASESSTSAAMLHTFNHAIIKIGLFIAVGYFIISTGKYRLFEMAGISRVMPYTTLMFTICLMSLMGFPGTAGFLSKLFLLKAALQESEWVIVFFMLTGFLISIFYTWRIFHTFYIKQPFILTSSKNVKGKYYALTALFIAAVMNIVFGLNTDFSYSLASQAAAYILE